MVTGYRQFGILTHLNPRPCRGAAADVQFPWSSRGRRLNAAQRERFGAERLRTRACLAASRNG